MLREVVLIHEDAFTADTVSRAVGRRVMLVARLLRIEGPVADVALPFFIVAMGRAVLNVLVICFPVGK
jgi:hypothetical protein